MTSFWENLSARERILVAVGAGLAALFIVLQLIIAPILDWRADKQRELASARGLYELVAEAAPRGGASAPAADGGVPVRNLVSQTASAAGVSIVYINARSDNGVDANISAAQPSALYDWLAALRNEHNIAVEAADIARETGNPEVVRAQLTLSRRG